MLDAYLRAANLLVVALLFGGMFLFSGASLLSCFGICHQKTLEC